jgi:hypothetical protein
VPRRIAGAGAAGVLARLPACQQAEGIVHDAVGQRQQRGACAGCGGWGGE